MRLALCSLILVAASAFPAYAAGCPETSTPAATYRTLADVEKAVCRPARSPTQNEMSAGVSQIRDCNAFVEIIVGYDIPVGTSAEGFLRSVDTTDQGTRLNIQWIEDDHLYMGVDATVAVQPGLIDRIFFRNTKKDARAICLNGKKA